MEHIPVLLEESVTLLLDHPRLPADAILVDATFGGGGHSRRLLERAPAGLRLVALDRDPAAYIRSLPLQAAYPARFRLLSGNFAELKALLAAAGIGGIDGLLLDLGLSSFQLAEGSRGFSFRSDGPLDMRMDPESGPSAAEVVNQATVETLIRIFRKYGEEPYARQIARRIVERRRRRSFTTTRELAALIEEMVPVYKRGRRHPATRVFQALRIYVNDELRALERVLNDALELLRPGGRLVVISYHSLEDRLVKQSLRWAAKGCICPPQLPVCVCGCHPRVRILTGRGLRPDAVEVERNPRSRSAVLRAAEIV